MNIYQSSYKDVLAVTVETETLTAKLLPHNGAKMASLVDKKSGRELLSQAVSENYKPIGLYTSFVDGECSAFDDMFPTIDPYTPESGPRAGLSYIDHGEVARSPFVWQIKDGSLVMSYESKRLAFTYEKIVTPQSNGSIKISYNILNDDKSDIPFDYLWAAHIMIAAEEGGQVVTSYKDGAQVEVIFDDFGRYGKRWDKLSFTPDMIKSNRFGENGDAYKLYFTDPAPYGRLSYVYPDGKALTLAYDAEKLPYIGVWMNNGHFKGMYNVAPEIASIPYDSPEEAAKRGVKSVIQPAGSVNFEIEISIDETM